MRELRPRRYGRTKLIEEEMLVTPYLEVLAMETPASGFRESKGPSTHSRVDTPRPRRYKGSPSARLDYGGGGGSRGTAHRAQYLLPGGFSD